MPPIQYQSALEQGKQLRAQKITARELLGSCLDQFARHNDSLNAVVVTDFDRALAAAEAADKRLAKGKALSLIDGVPMTAKESFDWTGTPTTWGSPAFQENTAESDAAAIRRLTAAGAVMYGKTNVPLMLADWQSFNVIYGTTSNPWDVSRAPGGSSGGSAVALATGMSSLEIGTDIGASLRNPAHYCGIYAHKPTYGVVPMEGHMLRSANPGDISVAGPMARSASDLIYMMKLLAGTEGIAARALSVKLPDRKQKTFKNYRVAVMVNDPVSEVDQAVQDKIMELAAFLGGKVKRLSHDARPDFSTREAMDVYIALLRAATSRRQTDDEFTANAAKSFQLDVTDQSYYAKMLRAYIMPHRHWLTVNERRHQMRLAWDAFFEDWDVLLCPAAASAAFPHDQQGDRHERLIDVNGKRVPTTDQLFWAGYSGCFYLPSTVAPLGLTPQGLPTGVQIIARQYEDLTALHFAELIEDNFFSFQPPPGY
jgi:amidase